jgi:anti-anti-sigma regulatory factor
MTKLDFISSAGLRVLLATAQELKLDGGELRVCSLNESIKEVFDISGFSALLGRTLRQLHGVESSDSFRQSRFVTLRKNQRIYTDKILFN